MSLHDQLVKKVASEVASEPSGRDTVIIDSEGLDKLAEILESGAPGPEFLKHAASVIRQTSAQREFLINELAVHERRVNATKVARDLADRGMCSKDDLDQTVEKVARLKNLGSVKDALDIIQTPESGNTSIGEVEKVADGEGDKLMEDPAVAHLLAVSGYCSED